MKYLLKTRSFCRWQRKTPLDDEALAKAVAEMEKGLVDADLGGNVYKKRVALPGRGKRGSARTIVAANRRDRWIFLFGFEKNERDNISPAELGALRHVAQDLLVCPDAALRTAVECGELVEIDHEETEQNP